MLLIEDLEVLCAGKKELLRLFKADAVFVAVLKVLSLIPLDLHTYGSIGRRQRLSQRLSGVAAYEVQAAECAACNLFC